jgi:FkbM family methyltransferase
MQGSEATAIEYRGEDNDEGRAVLRLEPRPDDDPPAPDATSATRQPARTRPLTETGATLSGVIAYNKYGAYCVPHSGQHRAAARKILAGKVWERHTLRFLRSHWRGGDLVHAGTFFGDFLPALTSRAPKRSKIWAFEPNPENFRCAQVTALLNNAGDQVELLNAAVGAAESSSAMLWRNRNGRCLGGASKILDAGRECRGSELSLPIRIVALDDVIPADRDVSIIQLDVEGYEQQALRGALGTIERCRPLLVLETVPDDAWLLRTLRRLGYRRRRRVDQNTVFRPVRV